MYRSLIAIGLLVALVGCSPEETKTTGASVEQEYTQIVFNPEHAPTVEISVPDMMCPMGCASKVHDVLIDQPGVVDVYVDFPERLAIVAVEEGQFDAEAAVHLLADDYGFPNTTLKTVATTTTTEPAADATTDPTAEPATVPVAHSEAQTS